MYGTVIAGGLAINRNLSLEGALFQAFLMERVLIVSNLQVLLELLTWFSNLAIVMSRNLSKISHFWLKNSKTQIRCSKSQYKGHFRNLWEKQMQIDTHITDITNDTIGTGNDDKILDQVLDPR